MVELLFSAVTMIAAYVGCMLLTPSRTARARLPAGSLATEDTSSVPGSGLV